MNEKNFDYLKDQVKYTGFGEALEGELRQNIEQQQATFTLKHDAFYGEDKVSAELNFKKSDQTDLYFFNSYKVNLQKEGKPESLEQTFYINKGNNITLKEAYNLMEGRAVNKNLTSREGQEYNAWVQLDFKDADANGNFRQKHYHENYGYDIEAVVSKHPIKELENPSHKDDLINSLKKGNRSRPLLLKMVRKSSSILRQRRSSKRLPFMMQTRSAWIHGRLRSSSSQRRNSRVQSSLRKQRQVTKTATLLGVASKRQSAVNRNRFSHGFTGCLSRIYGKSREG